MRAYPKPIRRVGPRGLFLLAWALVDYLFGIGLLTANAQIRASPTYAFPAQLMPIDFWAGLWIGVAIILTVAAFGSRFDVLGFTAAIGIKSLWAVLMLGGWAVGEIPRGFVSTGIWLGAAVSVGVSARYLPLSNTVDGS